MKVSKSTNVISHDVSSALRFLAEELHKPEYLTTAWYIEVIDKWFNLMTSRSPVMALSKLKPLVYEEAISFLNQFIDIMRKLKVGVKTLWKPSQSGSILATTSILQIQDIFLNDKGFKFLLTSRFTQDCLENPFCVLRSKNVVPNALQVKNNLKLVTVSQYLKDVSNGNCDEDERELLSGFLDVIQKPKVCNNLSEVKITDKLVEPHVLLLNNGELNSLYNICGYIIHSIKKKSKLCKNCLNFVGSNSSIDYEFTKLSRLKRFKKGCLFFCNKNTFDFFLKMEGSFQKFFPHIKDQNCDIKKFLIQQMNKIEFYIPECHNLRKYIINRFVIFRLKISGRKNSKLLNKYSSKSIDAHGKK